MLGTADKAIRETIALSTRSRSGGYIRARAYRWLAALFILTTLAADAFARAGGGRNAGGGGILGVILLPLVLIYAWYVNRRINAKTAQADALLSKLSSKDPAWDEAKLEAKTRKLFYEIEWAWCEQDMDTLSQRLTPDMLAQWKSQIDLLRESGQRNVMEQLNLNGVRIVEVQNYREKENDSFTACLDAGAIDYTVDGGGNIVDSNAGSKRAQVAKRKGYADFREFWTFQRLGDDWFLAAVDQSRQWEKFVGEPLVDEEESGPVSRDR